MRVLKVNELFHFWGTQIIEISSDTRSVGQAEQQGQCKIGSELKDKAGYGTSEDDSLKLLWLNGFSFLCVQESGSGARCIPYLDIVIWQ